MKICGSVNARIEISSRSRQAVVKYQCLSCSLLFPHRRSWLTCSSAASGDSVIRRRLQIYCGNVRSMTHPSVLPRLDHIRCSGSPALKSKFNKTHYRMYDISALFTGVVHSTVCNYASNTLSYLLLAIENPMSFHVATRLGVGH